MLIWGQTFMIQHGILGLTNIKSSTDCGMSNTWQDSSDEGCEDELSELPLTRSVGDLGSSSGPGTASVPGPQDSEDATIWRSDWTCGRTPRRRSHVGGLVTCFNKWAMAAKHSLRTPAAVSKNLSTVTDIRRQAGSILPVPQTISLTVRKL